MKFRNGAIGQALLSWAGHGEPTVIPRAIYGTKGCMKGFYRTGGSTIILDDGSRLEIEPLFEEKASQEVKETFFPYGIRDPRALETLEFLKAIKEGREMDTSGREGLRDLAASYAMIESSIANAPIKVDDVESSRIGRYEEEINNFYSL